MIKLQKLVFVLSLFFASLFTSSCNIEFLTPSLWESYYEEEIATFLISTDQHRIAFLAKKYHYVFTDYSFVMQKIIDLDHEGIVMMDVDKTELKLNKKNEIEGYITFKTFDVNLSPQIIDKIEYLGFKFSQEGQDYEIKLPVNGVRYRALDDLTIYLPIVDDKYKIKIHRDKTFGQVAEDVALTPLAIVGDSLIILRHLLVLPNED